MLKRIIIRRILLVIILLQFFIRAAFADVVDPQLLKEMVNSVCYAETFEQVKLAPGDRVVEGISGKALATRRNYTLDVTKILPQSTGTISWWARYNFDSTEGAPVISMNQSGALYILFFGTKGSIDVLHTEL